MKNNKYYKPLEIETMSVQGIKESLVAMRLPKGGTPFTNFSMGCNLHEKDARLAKALVKAGTDHAKFTRGIVVWVKLKMQTGWMIEFETYRHGAECLSTSSAMHGELKRLRGPELASKKQEYLRDKVYTRVLTLSYQVIRSMYRARKNHRHPDWRIFCQWVEKLPYFDTFIYPEGSKGSGGKMLNKILDDLKKCISSGVYPNTLLITHTDYYKLRDEVDDMLSGGKYHHGYNKVFGCVIVIDDKYHNNPTFVRREFRYE